MKLFLVIIITSFSCGLEASINSTCSSNNDCDTLDSYCGAEGKCICLNNFKEYKGDCVEILPHTFCLDDAGCRDKINQSVCLASNCSCIPHHHYASYEGCIRNRGLYEKCFKNNQCYWGKDMEGKISCMSGTCNCDYGYHQIENRKCGNGSREGTIISFGVLFLTISYLLML